MHLMETHPLCSERDDEAALARTDARMDAEPATPRGDELDVRATRVEAYEAREHPVESLIQPVERAA